MRTARLRRLVTTAAAAAALLASSVAVSGAAQAGADFSGYYKPTWTQDVYYSNGVGQYTTVTYAQWAAAGSPTPKPAFQDYEKFPWSAVIYRSTSLGPTPIELYHPLTAGEWVADRRPTPRPGSGAEAGVFRWGTSDELFAHTPDGVYHKLTRAEWDGLADNAPNHEHDNEGFIKLTWSSDIAFGANLGFGGGSPIDYATWKKYDFPTPRTAVRFPGDQFVVHAGSPTVYYSGPTMSRAITYAEWVAAGSPTPTVR